MTSIFTDNFPHVSNQEQLDKLIAKYSSYDEYYIASGSIPDRREIFDDLYKKYHLYADKYFLNQIKFQFHQRTWEMYLGCALLEKNIIISSNNLGPDFLIKSEGKKIWIECIACTKGSENSPDKVPSMIYGAAQSVPENEMCLRIASALKEKYLKYQNYLKQQIIKESDVFIIAINNGALQFPTYVPLILKCLFCVGHPRLSISIDGKTPKYDWSRQEYIKKENGSAVPMDFFIRKEHGGISGIIYCENNILNHTKILGDDVIVVSNPLANNTFPNILKSFKGYHPDPNTGELFLKID